MKYIFIGDVHGRVEHVERALAMDGKKIFVGDFVDSFDRPPIDQRKCIDLVLAAIKTGEAEAIPGNHELSYLMPNTHMCSGFSGETRRLILEVKDEINTLFKPFLYLEDSVLVTHAGLTRDIWDKYNMTKDTMVQQLTEWWPNPDSPMHWIGQIRGGPRYCGGTFWCDWREFTPVPDLTQVFGHTTGSNIRQKEQSFCVDCLGREPNLLTMEL